LTTAQKFYEFLASQKSLIFEDFFRKKVEEMQLSRAFGGIAAKV
jgi:hypothetical protein